jgi:hypothetical protein
MVIDTYEAFVYQIKLPSIKSKRGPTFHRGFVYKSSWITECIEAGEVVDEDNDKFIAGFHKKSKL